jgi:DNA polymerase (family 10)
LDEVTDFSLVRPCDIRGVLHSHSRYVDGAHSLEAMVETARAIGLEYLGISDHYHSQHHQNGLDIEAVARQRREVEALDARFPDFDILQGVELDANGDGTLPLADSDLLLFDYVIVSLPECNHCSEVEWTDRALRLLDHPLVSILGKPVGDFMLRPAPVPLDMKRVLDAASRANVALEIDANPHCAEIDWTHCRLAQEAGAYLAISPDAHRAARRVDFRHGAEMAREAGICCRSILNTLSAEELRRFLRRTA